MIWAYLISTTQSNVMDHSSLFVIDHVFKNKLLQMVNNYQSLTIVTKTHTPGVTRDKDPPLNLIVIKIHI